MADWPATTGGGADIIIYVNSNPSGGTAGVTSVGCGSSTLGLTRAVEVINTNNQPDISRASVAAHETGHALGLGHANDPRDLMAPTLSTYTREVCPSNMDIAALNGSADPTVGTSASWQERPSC